MAAAGKITVMGSGSWGTTFAKVMADTGREITLWARRRDVAEAIAETRENREYLPGVRLPDTLRSTSDPLVALDGVDTVVLAVPSQTLRHNLTAWRGLLHPGATLVSLAKGVELGTLKRMSEVVVDVTGVGEDQVAVVSGPNLAKEIALEQPTATVIACRDHDRAVALQRACTTGYFRPYTITDVVGCELGGAGKNVIALSCGMADGLGFGANTLATLITRGLAEITRLGAALGADPMTFAGLAGLGDLVASCSSPLSRNRTFGARLGRGETMAQAQAAVGGQVAEGVKSCSPIRELALRHGVEMPITDVVHRVCHDGFDLREMAGELIGRKTRPER
ncbi:NAD(P)H-dependent glycerol-3-phosphate dehydrogenase [Actinokineospora sp. NBRC 105648]|uniref:NAD(P)H-dependent glycerol-3-phosphate dehydrogenase n=1 Tax=Actinokineospora sp. NBRC 105648 TaxID=3032206 RepID=UPI0024A2FD04|nr:NAD(P)H-dependent glycerol-3-phosphate dehydrogenase [Actinokineospora sp. NBRC 105648]GLZ41708.1 glycerol-3-phosphate dehydrogenase [NAD(P)+] [Actinokineospora sp. NBRC 105648]